jgi:hypothetical protein
MHLESPYIPANAQTLQGLLFSESDQPIMPTETLKIVYYSYFHSFFTYEIIFGAVFPLVSRFLESKRE